MYNYFGLGSWLSKPPLFPPKRTRNTNKILSFFFFNFPREREGSENLRFPRKGTFGGKDQSLAGLEKHMYCVV